MTSTITEVKFEVQWTVVTDVPIVGPFYTLLTYANEREEEKKMCQLTVYVQQQGEMMRMDNIGAENELVPILTVHDVGTNPQNSFIKFVDSPAMTEFAKKAFFLHVCVPGQEPGAKNFVGEFPTMDQMAQMLPQVLGHFGLNRCFALGEGAGADVVCRFALNNADLVWGIVPIHCSSTTHGIIDNLKEMLANLRIGEGKMSDIGWDYLMGHKFGEKHDVDSRKQFIEHIRAQGLNEHNLSQYLHAFCSRDDFTNLLEICSSKFDSILVTGGKSPHNKNIFHMFEHMDKERTGLIVAEKAVDILVEAPEYLVQTLQLLCQRHPRHAPPQIGQIKRGGGAFSIGDGDDQLPKPAIHPAHPPTTTSAEKSAQKVAPPPSIRVVPQDKPSALQAIPQNPDELLPGKYDPPNGAALPQNPADLLPGQLIIQQPMSKCASSLSQMSNLECPHCGKECCWCREVLFPGSPLE